MIGEIILAIVAVVLGIIGYALGKKSGIEQESHKQALDEAIEKAAKLNADTDINDAADKIECIGDPATAYDAASKLLKSTIKD